RSRWRAAQMQAGPPPRHFRRQEGHRLCEQQRSPSRPGAEVTASLVVLFAINILNFYDRQVLATLTEPVRKEFHLSDTQIGWMTTAFTLLYAVIGVPLGRLADRWSRKKLLASGITVWSALTASTAVAGTYGF